MAEKSPIDQLLNKKMSRKDFIAHVGVAVVSVIGVSAAIKNLSELGRKPRRSSLPARPATRGFGGGRYGA